MLSLYREKYFDFNVRHFYEKLREEESIELSYMWVKLALQGAGLVKKGRKRGVHRKRRSRRPLPGMLLHMDGSEHTWFQDERWYDLLAILDDANTEANATLGPGRGGCPRNCACEGSEPWSSPMPF